MSIAATHTHQITQSLQDLYKKMPNYTGSISVGGQEWPISRTIFSNTKETRIGAISFALLNIISRISRLHLVGNTAVPCFSQVTDIEPWEKVHSISGNPYGIYLINAFNNKVKNVPHYISFQADPMMVVNIRPHWKTFDDYLSDFSSKYRVRCKKVLKDTEHATFTEYHGEEITVAFLEEIAALLKKTLSGKILAMPPNLKQVISDYITSFGKNYVVRIYKQNEKTIGFIGFVLMPECVMAMHLGFATPENQNMPIYQRMLYEMVDYTIQNQRKTLNLGRTAVEIKSCMGAEPIENYYIAYIKSPIICAFANFYKKLFYRPKKYTVRKPFKD